jgi:hypothetical protein
MNIKEVRTHLEALSRRKAQLTDQLNAVREAEWVWLRKYDAAQLKAFQLRAPDALSDAAIDKMSVADLKKLRLKIKESIVKRAAAGGAAVNPSCKKTEARLERENAIETNAQAVKARLEALASQKAKPTLAPAKE